MYILSDMRERKQEFKKSSTGRVRYGSDAYFSPAEVTAFEALKKRNRLHRWRNRLRPVLAMIFGDKDEIKKVKRKNNTRRYSAS